METATTRLRGWIDAKPIVRYTQAGDRVLDFPVRVERWRTRNGAREQVTDRHRIVVLNPRLIDIATSFAPGDPVDITGTLQFRTFQDQQRRTHSVPEIVLHRGRGRIALRTTDTTH